MRCKTIFFDYFIFPNFNFPVFHFPFFYISNAPQNSRTYQSSFTPFSIRSRNILEDRLESIAGGLCIYHFRDCIYAGSFWRIGNFHFHVAAVFIGNVSCHSHFCFVVHGFYFITLCRLLQQGDQSYGALDLCDCRNYTADLFDGDGLSADSRRWFRNKVGRNIFYVRNIYVSARTVFWDWRVYDGKQDCESEKK
jgi:hypothetical protein